jgi:hypothetical protein
LLKVVQDPTRCACTQRDYGAAGDRGRALGQRARAYRANLAVGLGDDQVGRQFEELLRVDLIEGFARGETSTNARVDLGAGACGVEGRKSVV